MTATRKRLRSLVVAGGVMGVALGVNLVPASAHHKPTPPPATYKDGYGSFVATSYPNTEFCADYSNYTAALTFSDGTTATVKSSSNPADTDYVWGEFADGTYDTDGPRNPAGVEMNAPCPGSETYPPDGGGGDDIERFTGTLTKAGANGGRACTLSDGTYQRGHMGTTNPELNIMYVFKAGCGASTTNPIVLKTTIVHVHHDDTPLPPFGATYTAACNSPIAPQTCELGPAEHPGEWGN
jgi:hypothetical protein